MQARITVITLGVDELEAALRFYRDGLGWATEGIVGTEFAHDGVVAHGEGTSSGGIFFTDPDGTRLEVYAPNGAQSAPAPSGAAPTCGFF